MITKLVLFIIYAVVAFGGLFVVLFQDDPALSQSHFAKFLLIIWILFCIAAIASCFLPLKFSYIAPAILLVAFLLVNWVVAKELEKFKNPANLATSNGYVANSNNFMCESGSFLTIDAGGAVTYHYIGASPSFNQNSAIAHIAGKNITMDGGPDPVNQPLYSQNNMHLLSDCKNMDGKSISDIYQLIK